MAGHAPNLDSRSLARLRALVSAMQAENGKGVPLANLVALKRDLHFETGLTIDFDATAAIGAPMVVLRIPTAGENRLCLDGLTKRENEVARLVALGLGNAEIAAELCISLSTVKDHVHNILKKTNLRSRTAIAAAFFNEAAP